MKALKYLSDKWVIFQRKRYARKNNLVLNTLDPEARGRIYDAKVEAKLVEIRVIRADGTEEVIAHG